MPYRFYKPIEDFPNEEEYDDYLAFIEENSN